MPPTRASDASDDIPSSVRANCDVLVCFASDLAAYSGKRKAPASGLERRGNQPQQSEDAGCILGAMMTLCAARQTTLLTLTYRHSMPSDWSGSAFTAIGKGNCRFKTIRLPGSEFLDTATGGEHLLSGLQTHIPP
jgi:hypothetical protein